MRIICIYIYNKISAYIRYTTLLIVAIAIAHSAEFTRAYTSSRGILNNIIIIIYIYIYIYLFKWVRLYI